MSFYYNQILVMIIALISCGICVADTPGAISPQNGVNNQAPPGPIGSGFFEFRSNVEGATVFLDNQTVGTIREGSLKIPVDVFEKPVTRELRIEAGGYSTYHETLVKGPKAGETMVVRGTLQVVPLNLTGSLSLAVSPPGSTVSIDNVSAGVVDQSGIMSIRTINSGSRTIKVTMPGYKDSVQQIYVTPNLENKVRITLDPVTTGTLDISSNPAGAAVSINGMSYGITPVTTGDLEQGSYLIGFNLPGYQNAQSQVILSAGQRVPVSIYLQPIPTATPTPILTTSEPTPTSTPTPEAGFTPALVILGLLCAFVIQIKRK
ncbi:MAG TPA: PEGA domain-containing protein [Methanospirillum sp.]|uniref:PEGA domain-containing protein n=1 Tax=Methanospirillum sp. TaxID=45200 RepID=UPI002BD5A311|nr:PEGA domain-containing protein [Methanospirillum sp.]HWQ64447.1 PEGA domain-containing protein [Methanospirillum sp.]